MTVVRHMFYGTFGTQSSMVTFIFRFDTRKGQTRSKKLNFQNQNLLLKHAYLVQFCLRIPQMSFIFTYGSQKCQKLPFKKVTSSHLPVFLAIAQPKKNIALKFCICVVCKKLYNMYFFFWITPKFWILQAFVFEKSKF